MTRPKIWKRRENCWKNNDSILKIVLVVLTSINLLNYEKNNEEIQALLDEIALLREELLNKEIELLNEKIKDDNFKMNRKI